MPPTTPRGLRELQQWLSAGKAEAERLLPHLLGLPVSALCRELRARPELHTPPVMEGLLDAASNAVHRLPSRSYELTVLVIRYSASMSVPPSAVGMLDIIQGSAWREYARALRELERLHKAMHALRVSRSWLAKVPGNDWHLATVDLVEAPLLDDLGRHGEALRMIRRAA